MPINAREPLRFIAPFHKYNTGYSKAARGLLRALTLAGFEVAAIESDLREQGVEATDGRISRLLKIDRDRGNVPLTGPQAAELDAAIRMRADDSAPTLLLQIPHNFYAWWHYGATPRIGYTMTESDSLCRDWAHGCLSTDMLIAPSQHCREVFGRVVPDVPCALVPIPVDERIWTADEYREGDLPRNRPPFLFLSVIQATPRKQWRLLMQAFAEEFRGEERREVGLIVKPTGGEVGRMADWCREMGAWVHVDTEKRTDWTLGALYRACNVYLQPSSEGFGLPFVEAALCGLPSIALDKSGSADVVTEEVGYVCPSSWEPIIGHMPHWYPRKATERDPSEHRFAVPDIDDLRATLRRAYEEEKGGAGKGAAARERALRLYTPEAIAPALREAIEAGIGAHQKNVRNARHPERPQSATVCGNWGDIFCALGEVRKMMADKELKDIGLIYYGRDRSIETFLREQPWVREVVAIIEPDKEEMTRVYGRLSQAKPEHGRAAWKRLLEAHGVGVEGDIAYTQLCLAEDREPVFWHGAKLPKDATDWAFAEIAAAGLVGEEGVRPFLLCNPLSVASNAVGDHWGGGLQRWSEALVWLIGASSVPVVLVGEQRIDWPEHPNLVNLSGQSRTMMDVLALAELAAGIVTTGNNLGLYAAICERPAVVVAARTLQHGNIYWRWYDALCSWQTEDGLPERAFVQFEEPMSDFQRACEARFPQFVQTGVDLMSEADYYRLGRA